MDKSLFIGKNKHIDSPAWETSNRRVDKKPKGMNHMKKTLPIICALALMCCGLTACGDKDDNSSATGDKNATIIENSDPGLDNDSSDGFSDENGSVLDDRNDESKNDTNAGDRIVTDIENAADDLVSDGGDIIDDVGDMINETD